MSENKVILIGYSGHGYVVSEAASIYGYLIIGYVDKLEQSKNPFNLEYLGFEGSKEFKGWNINAGFILGIGDNKLRCEIATKISQNNGKIFSVIHPEAKVASASQIGEGVFIARNASVNPLGKIGKYSIINTGAIVEHECIIEDGAHIAPGAVLAGNVKIGRMTFIGANAVVKQGVEIGENAIIGAGSVVLEDVLANKVVVGNPAREINQ